jgi:hypothetical protein
VQIILLPYPENPSFFRKIQKLFSPKYRHSCLGFKQFNLVLNLSGEGLTFLDYSEFVKDDYLVIEVKNSKFPVRSVEYFKGKRVTICSLILGGLGINLKNQFWCTDLVSKSLDELGILEFKPKRHPIFFTELTKN